MTKTLEEYVDNFEYKEIHEKAANVALTVSLEEMGIDEKDVETMKLISSVISITIICHQRELDNKPKIIGVT